MEHLAAFPGVLDLFAAWGITYQATAQAWTMRKDGIVIACYGIQQSQPEVGELWLFATPGEPLLTVAKTVKRRLDAGKAHWRRITATARADAPVALRFLAWLGMTPEGRLHRYAVDGTDHILFAFWRD